MEVSSSSMKVARVTVSATTQGLMRGRAGALAEWAGVAGFTRVAVAIEFRVLDYGCCADMVVTVAERRLSGCLASDSVEDDVDAFFSREPACAAESAKGAA